VIILEQIDHLGRVKERYRLDSNRVRVGRGFDNDIIINDPFVCAHHVEIEARENNGITVHDLDSVNGIFAYGNNKRTEKLQLNSGERMRIGHTLLRYYSIHHPVAESRQDRLSTDLFNDLLNSSVVLWSGYLLLALLSALSSYLGSYSEFEMLELFRAQLLPYAFVLLVWPGFWALLSRITTHSFYFRAHSIIATVILLSSLLYDEFAEPILRFSFSLDDSLELISYLISFSLMGIAFYAHLRFCSAQSSKRLALYAISFAVVIVSLAYMEDYDSGQEYSSYPEYHAAMMPPAFQMTEEVSVDEFFARVESLDSVLQREIDRHNEEQ